MIEQAKIAAAKDFLKSKFTDFQIDDTVDTKRLSQKFRVSNDSTIYIVEFERKLFDDTGTPNIKRLLQDWELSKFMQRGEGRPVLVTKRGLEYLANSSI